jgi:hypothetical protein
MPLIAWQNQYAQGREFLFLRKNQRIFLEVKTREVYSHG